MRDHTKLRAFELADEWASNVYQATKGFPEEETYFCIVKGIALSPQGGAKRLGCLEQYDRAYDCESEL
ncbi:MAG: hypothetical protein ACE5IY_03755 [bacterium]